MKTLTRITTPSGNDIEFLQTDLLPSEHVIVHDHSCQLERTYKVGLIQELDGFEEMEIKSVKQVIDSWSSGRTWF